MERKIKFFVVAYFSFLFLGTLSCTDCGNVQPFNISLNVSALQGQANKISYNNLNTQNLNGILLEAVNDEALNYDQFAIKVDLIKAGVSSTNYLESKSGFLNSAFACSPAVNSTTVSKIEGLTIRSTNKFNSSISGEDLSKYFDVILSDSEKKLVAVKYDLTEYAQTKTTAPDLMIFILKESPKETGNYAFTIEFTQTESAKTKLDFTTNPVQIIAK